MELRAAGLADLDAILALEEAGFETDRFTRRSLRHLLTRAHAVNLVAEEERVVVGYATVLLRRSTALARLYSIAVSPSYRGRGIGDRLLTMAEEIALRQGCVVLRLEVQAENESALRLYRRHDYREFGLHLDYYDDHSNAIRMEKVLTPKRPPVLPVPFYRQTLEFTCGAAALLMALRTFDPSYESSRVSELRLWRESTSIFMTSGHGGCGPHGLALAAQRRGFGSSVHGVSDREAMFVESVRSEEKRKVIRLVEQDFKEQLAELGVLVDSTAATAEDLRRALASGAIPIVLISLYRLAKERAPHWVTVTGVDDQFVYVHDPWVDHAGERTLGESANLPIARDEFEGMARYGRRAQQATVLIWQRQVGEQAR